jgi:outer membrane protein OmpA-like peptidoglycan-associated protein
VVLALAAGALRPASAAEELNWAQQLVGPVEGSEARHNETFEFGRYNFAAGPEEKGTVSKVTQIEGERSAILYSAAGKSTFQIISVYKKFFKEKGYETLFSCEGKACGEKFRGAWYDLNPFENDYGWNNSAPIKNGSWESQFYLAAVKKGAAGDTYVSVYTNSGWWNFPAYRVDVARPAPLGTGIVPAAKIAEAMAADGRLAFYGINFDTDSSFIKTESGPVLAEIAAFLKSAPADTFYVTGHTDDEGDLQSNMSLSLARAQAVVNSLSDLGAGKAMLSAHGAGPLSPVATNFTPEGRALNRRVEIVKTMKGRRDSAAAQAAQARENAGTAAAAAQAAAQTAAQTAAQASAQAAAQAQLQAAQGQAAQVQAAAQASAQAAAASISAAKASPRPEENLIPVPKVTGMLLTPGMNILASQGFKINRLGQTMGIIQKQDPAPNTRVKPGSIVTITVGK